MKNLRLRLWNNVFTYDISLYERYLLNRMEDFSTLLLGDTGTGKGTAAGAIGRSGYIPYDRDKGLFRESFMSSFISINLSLYPESLIESELFGHKKGAFTGAIQDRNGLLRAADKGMLFLDEVGELGLDEQSMLLRAIEEKKFLPLGSDEEAASDFQLICGTNRDLHNIVAKGCFREDLLCRINLWTFHMPGLAERPEDIEPNLKYELDRFAERNNIHVTFNKEAWKQFLQKSFCRFQGEKTESQRF